VHPGRGAVDDPIAIDDGFDVPVFVRHSSPLKPPGRPRPKAVRAAWAPLPPGAVPGPGDYLVRTSWRAVLHAAITVGRDVTPWLSRVPRLAELEIVSRCAPLRAYLRRQRVDGAPPRYRIAPNEVYQRGTEITAKGAFSYRVGMTMAEWLCWGQLGMSHSLHAEDSYPPDTDPDRWDGLARKPDLLGVHGSAPRSWLVEAKAQRRLTKLKLREGAAQLDLDGLVDGPHRRVLCGTSLEDCLFMTLDIDTRDPAPGSPAAADPDPDPDPGRVPDPATDDEALYHLARSSMLVFLALTGNAAGTTVVPVGPVAVRGPGVTLLESDESTAALRERLRQRPQDARRLAAEAGTDMLTTPVPGAGLTVGLSRRLFAACQFLIEAESALAEEAEQLAEQEFADPQTRRSVLDVLRSSPDLAAEGAAPPGRAIEGAAPPGRPAAGWRRVEPEVRNLWRLRTYRQLARRNRYALLSAAREGFDLGRDLDWRRLTGRQVPLAVAGPPRLLESASTDAYLAIDPAIVF
jgi:hypothetical protein